jgi:SAM-dependent methyltransferase
MELPNRAQMHEANRQSWNAATQAHNSHKRDQATFLRNGGSTLRDEELALLGDIAGKTLLHLQCNSGQDSLSLAARQAEVTGVDISDEAISQAVALARDSGIAAEFCRADVYDWLAQASRRGQRFDIVFCSYGALCWLSDLTEWARGVAAVLESGGCFVTVEFHPVAMMFNEDFELAFLYFGNGVALRWDEGVSDYVADAGASLAPSGFEAGVRQFKNPHPAYEFQWPVAAILTALLDAGLHITHVQEFPYSNGAKLFHHMREMPDGRIYPPASVPDMPMLLGIKAVKPGLRDG